jgi:hypothetical protein
MRFLSSTLSVATALGVVSVALAACAPGYEDGHLSREINKQRVARDMCLAAEVKSLDDRTSRPEMIGIQATEACSPQNDRLIQLMATMDRASEASIVTAVRKDSVVKATSYVLGARSTLPQ